MYLLDLALRDRVPILSCILYLTGRALFFVQVIPFQLMSVVQPLHILLKDRSSCKCSP